MFPSVKKKCFLLSEDTVDTPAGPTKYFVATFEAVTVIAIVVFRKVMPCTDVAEDSVYIIRV